jgi:hypothetical protein
MRPDVPAWRRSAALLALCLAFAAPAIAQKPCSKSDAAAAEKAIDRVLAWPAMHKAWKDYGHCDTGQVADLFTEALLRLIVGNWPKIAELEPSFNSDVPYREWILARIAGGAMAKGDVDDVHDLSQNSCPKSQKRLCDALHEAAEKAQGKGAPPPPKPAAPAAPAAPAPAAPAAPSAPAPAAPPKPAT